MNKNVKHITMVRSAQIFSQFIFKIKSEFILSPIWVDRNVEINFLNLLVLFEFFILIYNNMNIFWVYFILHQDN